jgi:hypothetical protein
MPILRQIAQIKEKDVKKNQGHYSTTMRCKVLLPFPNIEAVLRLLLRLMGINCSGRRRLRHIKNELWTTVLQEKLSVLSFKRIGNYKS